MSYNGYGHVVDSCPHNETEVTAAATRLNCTEDRVGHNLYTCVPKFDLTSLVEFCYNATGKVSPFPKDHCLRIEPSGVLQSYRCSQFTEGCSTDYYLRSEMFQFPACSQINTEQRCFYADPYCPNETVSYTTEDGAVPTDTTTLMNVFNTTANVSSTVTTPVDQGSIDVGIIIGIILAVFVLCIVIAVVFWRRRRRMRKPKRKKDREKKYSPVPEEDPEMLEMGNWGNNVIGEYSTWRTSVSETCISGCLPIGSVLAVIFVLCIVLAVVFCKRKRIYSRVPEEDPKLAELRNFYAGEYSTWKTSISEGHKRSSFCLEYTSDSPN